MGIKRRTSSKNPPILSHEFIIQNHADIVSCVAMVFVIGLMFQVTAPFASMFVAMHHNVTSREMDPDEPPRHIMYQYGVKDLCVSFFYLLICIVMHAIIQEYILDKVNRKMHLSKVKHSKFNESGQLAIFYIISVLWGGDIIVKENYLLNINKLWEDYPHIEMTFMFKFFYIVQLAYWLHCLPELYFQKIKREEISARVQYAVLYFVFILAAYLLNFTRVALCLIIMHYIVETVFHVSRLLYFADNQQAANTGFMLWNVMLVLTRLASITLTVLTFWYGLALTEDISTKEGSVIVGGNFNNQVVRLNSLVAVCVLQAWMMWNFINFHLRRMREQAALAGPAKKPKTIAKKSKTAKKDENKKVVDEDVNELPEVDQNTKKDLRNRTVVTKSAKK